MRRMWRSIGVAVALTVAVTASLLGAGPATAQNAGLAQRFVADSGDRCPYGETWGQLTWDPNFGTRPSAVHVRGVLTDRPAPADLGACADDAFYTVATYAAYAGRTLVDRETRRADNQTVPVSFDLAAPWAHQDIDRVVITVCRYDELPGPDPRHYCGEPQIYQRVIPIPTPELP